MTLYAFGWRLPPSLFWCVEHTANNPAMLGYVKNQGRPTGAQRQHFIVDGIKLVDWSQKLRNDKHTKAMQVVVRFHPTMQDLKKQRTLARLCK